MSLFSELKRRNVFKIGAAYLIVAWLLMQVAALAVPALRLPEWVTTFVVFILMLGFPVALLLAWAFEVTPEGIKKTKDVPLEKSVRKLRGQKINFAIIGLLAVAVVVLLVERTQTDRVEPPGSIEGREISIAVLPFENLSGDPDQEHFVDGLTEELLNSLAAIENFRVISRTSSFTYKNNDVPVREIAAELGVSHILEGSVRRVGDRIRVTAQLIDASTDSHIWFENFDRDLTLENILEIQEIVARTVADRLQLKLPVDSNHSTGPVNLQALDRYHDGMYYVRRMTLADGEDDGRTVFEAAVQAFEASVEADPEWAPPHAGLGMAYHFNRHLGDEAEILRTSRRHLERALELDETLGSAWNSLGYVNSMEHEFEAAFAAYDRAREYGYDYHWGLAILLRQHARYEEAVDEYTEALRLNPLSREIRHQLIDVFYCSGQYRQAISHASDVLRVEPSNGGIKHALANAYSEIGDLSNATRFAEELISEFRSDSLMAYVLAKSGEHERARNAIEANNSTDIWWVRSPAAAALGDDELAIDILLEAVEEELANDTPDLRWFGRIRCMPALRNLEGNPRYDALIERLDLPE